MTEFTLHAEKRLQRRGITKEDVEHAIAHPAGHVMPGARDDTVEQSGFTERGGILHMVRSAINGCVITAWWELKQ